MAYNGAGIWLPPAGQPVVTGTVISSATFNTLVTDIQNTFNLVVTRDGQGPVTTVFKITDGTVTAPSIAFNAESSTGIYRSAAGVLALTIQGVLAASLSGTGLNIVNAATVGGILGVTGATTLSSTLGVTGAATLASTLSVTGAVTLSSTLSATGTATAASFIPTSGTVPTNGLYLGAANTLTLSTASTERVRIDSSGNVGIGASPSYRFHTTGTGSNAILAVTSSDASGGTTFVQANSSIDARFGTFSNLPVLFMSNSLQRAQFDTSGNFGIGAGTPTARLSVGIVTDTSNTVSVNAKAAGFASVAANVNSSAAVELYGNFTGSNDVYGMPTGTVGIASFNSTPLLFGVNGAERMRIDSSGNVGVGKTPSGSYKLDVAGALSVFVSTTTSQTTGAILEGGASSSGQLSPAIQFSGSNVNASIYSVRYASYGGDLVFATQGNTVGLPTERVRIDTGGALLVNSTSTVWALAGRGLVEVNGSASSLYGMKVGGSAAGYMYHDGTNVNIMNTLSGSLYLGAGNISRVNVDNSGNLNIIGGSGKLTMAGQITRFESAEQTCPTIAGLYGVAHGGPRKPDVVQAVLRCKTAEGGWSVGDELTITDMTTDNSRAYQTYRNSASVGLNVISPGQIALRQTQAAGSALFAPTTANWRLVFYCIWL